VIGDRSGCRMTKPKLLLLSFLVGSVVLVAFALWVLAVFDAIDAIA
jgi:hypothetical protein